jgi:hypothetical protein
MDFAKYIGILSSGMPNKGIISLTSFVIDSISKENSFSTHLSPFKNAKANGTIYFES